MQYAYKNLSVYLICGTDTVCREYVTLEEAMERQLLVIHETGNVGELSADNNSEHYVFIMSGDIVKGGRQDRTIADDTILKPGAAKVPLPSFCVEQSRWHQRGHESAAHFDSSKEMLSNRKLRRAARSERDQGQVWAKVAEFQGIACKMLDVDVTSPVSASSLQLTLENKDIQKLVDDYVKHAQPLFEDKENVLGFAFSVNGNLSTVDTFGSAALFSKLRTKLLKSAASEAAFSFKAESTFTNPSEEEVNGFIVAASKGHVAQSLTGEDTVVKRYKKKSSEAFQTFHFDECLHTAIYTIDKDETDGENQQYQYGGFRRRW